MATLKSIKEAKQVGTIYHYTDLDHLHHILHQEHPFTMGSHNGETISATRNPQLPLSNKTFADHDVRIALDGDKISENHKVRPVAGLTDNEGDVLNHKHNNHRVKRNSGEAEETIVKHPFNIKPFIKHIHIIKNRHNVDNVEKHIIPKLKEHGIPHSYTKAFSLSSLKEEYSGLSWYDCFIIEIN